ncbi:MAG TPA: DUF5996 family protein, partial [Dehalococcoidia bacterium]|nr:DUF5996 family protein [Dehalococcoidia bacterium]
MMTTETWPPLPLEEWQETLHTLHMWTQIAGKVKLRLSPFLNEWWQVALHLTARGLTTATIPSPSGVFQIDFDFIDHHLYVRTSDGDVKAVPLAARSVAGFYEELMGALRSLGIGVEINTTPDEVEERIPFEQDEQHASYDLEYVGRWWQIILRTSRVLETYRSTFVGKSSPIHFWWGGFDLSETRFSGKPATRPSGAGRMMRISEDQENFSVGFWAGSTKLGGPAFYSYMYPEPPGVRSASISPAAARFGENLGEFNLAYDDVRLAADPEAMILEFFRSSYETCASLAKWDRSRLEQPVPKLSRHSWSAST